MRLTHHFHLNEFQCRDGTPYPAEWINDRLRLLCLDLETLRTALGGKPLYISSGYRTADYNRAIGGARRSQHVEGRAVDLFSPSVSVDRLQTTARRLILTGDFHVIRTLGLYPTFTHLDMRLRSTLLVFHGTRVAN
jgi:uncharacterized protein YcbK (DUF882 family)